ncbi:hypothetical protein LCGC14_0477550 [marine sediment metagenome]|uniref:Uncharacterized protein n=1 Tax=marine sediment metagenome TaxID=412755 RepID=A0A0F9SFM4_9ZZZZ
MKYKLYRFEFSSILIGIFFLYLVFTSILQYNFHYQESNFFRIMLSVFYVFGSFSLIEGSSLLRSRYKKDEEFKKRIERLK